jgi:hypothetical protein
MLGLDEQPFIITYLKFGVKILGGWVFFLNHPEKLNRNSRCAIIKKKRVGGQNERITQAVKAQRILCLFQNA